LRPDKGKILLDCTAGRGGHSLLLANAGAQVVSIDVDERNLQYAKERLAGKDVRFFSANFSQIADVAKAAGIPAFDGILADLGVSTNQLFDENYGLSFANEMPLDMRLGGEGSGRTAADLVNSLDEQELADIFFHLGEERYSRRVARKIVAERRTVPITDTSRLADIVRSAIPGQGRGERIDPATRTFMALRMAVNRELDNLRDLLQVAPRLLKSGARLAVISFHSGEDREVKQAFRILRESGAYESLTNKPITPTDDEVRQNPRSRSAKMRVIQKA
jgi:16S rRNA (cytosine1402-N4)-methyltransferase